MCATYRNYVGSSVTPRTYCHNSALSQFSSMSVTSSPFCAPCSRCLHRPSRVDRRVRRWAACPAAWSAIWPPHRLVLGTISRMPRRKKDQPPGRPGPAPKDPRRNRWHVRAEGACSPDRSAWRRERSTARGGAPGGAGTSQDRRGHGNPWETEGRPQPPGARTGRGNRRAGEAGAIGARVRAKAW